MEIELRDEVNKVLPNLVYRQEGAQGGGVRQIFF